MLGHRFFIFFFGSVGRKKSEIFKKKLRNLQIRNLPRVHVNDKIVNLPRFSKSKIQFFSIYKNFLASVNLNQKGTSFELEIRNLVIFFLIYKILGQSGLCPNKLNWSGLNDIP